MNEEYYHDTQPVARMPNIVSPLKQVMEGHILLTYFFSKLFPFSDSLEFLKKRKKKMFKLKLTKINHIYFNFLI